MFIPGGVIALVAFYLILYFQYQKGKAKANMQRAEREKIEALLRGQGLDYHLDGLLRKAQEKWPYKPLNRFLTKEEIDSYRLLHDTWSNDEKYESLIQTLIDRGI